MTTNNTHIEILAKAIVEEELTSADVNEIIYNIGIDAEPRIDVNTALSAMQLLQSEHDKEQTGLLQKIEDQSYTAAKVIDALEEANATIRQLRGEIEGLSTELSKCKLLNTRYI